MRFTNVAGALASLALGVDAQTKVPVDPALYEDLVYYARYVKGTQPCPNPPNGNTVQAYINIESTDTQATLFRDDTRAEFVLAFPGTNGLRDALTDFAILPVPYLPLSPKLCPGCTVHLGFYTAWESAADAVKASLDAALATPAHADYTLVIGGSSLGAALSNLAFASLKTQPQYAVRAVYNSGQPRVGNQAYADYVDELAGASATEAGIFYRATHADDGVPKLLPAELGFRHSGTEYWESEVNATAATTYRCFGQEPADCINSQNGFGANAAHVGYAGYEDATC